MKVNLRSIWILSDCLKKSSFVGFKERKLMGSSPSQIVIERVLPGFMVLILLSVISVLAPKPLYGAQALVYADFTVGAIAAYSGPSGHSNDYAVTFAEQNITNFRVSQDCAYWGCGDGATQGNDFAVTVTMSQTGKSDFSFPATFNWVRNNRNNQVSRLSYGRWCGKC